MENRSLFLDDLANHIAIKSPEKADVFREGLSQSPPKYSMDFVFNLAVSEGKKAKISTLWYIIAILRWTYKTYYLKEYEGDIFRFYGMKREDALKALKKELVDLNRLSYLRGKEGIDILIEAAKDVT